jgi:hypothetical protein
VGDSATIASTHSILGNSLHFGGDLGSAGVELAATLESGPRSQRTTAGYLGFEAEFRLPNACAVDKQAKPKSIPEE